jgi:hypothetical protein
MTNYETDICKWSDEQETALRAGDFASLDIDHIADEIGAIGRMQKHKFMDALRTFLATVYLSEINGKSSHFSPRRDFMDVDILLSKSPSLVECLLSREWIDFLWQGINAEVLTDPTSEVVCEEVPRDRFTRCKILEETGKMCIATVISRKDA